jgi:hypothetical protein
MFTLAANRSDEEGQLYSDDVFSTYLYTGNGSTQTINNGISLASTTGFSSQVVSTTGSANISCSAIYGSDTYLGGYVTESTYGRPFIVKVSGGSVVWSKTIREVDFGPHDFVGTTSIKVDSTGVYVCGGTVSSSTWYTFVCKFDLSGTLLWQTYIKTNNANYPAIRSKLTIDESNQVYVASTAGDAEGSGYVQITKLTSSGVQSWSKKLDRYTTMDVNIAYDSLTSSIIVSTTSSDGVTNATIIIKIASSDGTLAWSKLIYYTLQNFDPGTTRVKNILIDSSSNIILQILATSMNSNNSQASHIIKLNSSGATVFGRAGYNSLRSASYKYYTSCLDSSDNIYVSSYNYTENGLNYIFKLNSSGTLIWSRTLDHTGRDAVIGMVISGNNLIITCYDEVKNTTEIITLDKDNPRDSATTSVGTIGLTTGNWVDSTAYGAIANYVTDGSTTYGAASAIVVGTANLTINNPVGTLSSTAATNYSAINSSGGMVWLKGRSVGSNNTIFDTARGTMKYLLTNSVTSSQNNAPYGIDSFNSNGFGWTNDPTNDYNMSGATYVSWTFRKAPKFFDVVTWTGNGTDDGSKLIQHSLGSVPGMIVAKKTTSTGDWCVKHRSNGTNNGILLNSTAAEAGYGFANNINGLGAATSTQFPVRANLNDAGANYVAYLFAHDTSSTGIIQCGSYTGSASTVSINLGWEPQYVLIKPSTTASGWVIVDSMRGTPVGGQNARLYADASYSEGTGINGPVSPTATGFTVPSTDIGWNNNGQTYIYMAIRRPNKPPTTGTQVYNAITRTGTGAAATVTGVGFAPDLVQISQRPLGAGKNWVWVTRLCGNAVMLSSDNSGAEFTNSVVIQSDSLSTTMDGFRIQTANPVNSASYTYINYSLKRAPGFFDEVCYTGNGVLGQTYNHNLTVSPELIIIKARNSARNWAVYPNTLSSGLYLNLTGSFSDYGSRFTSISSTTFGVQNDESTNFSGYTYVAYLFATLAGISKVGSYTGNGTSQNIECGFAAGARFVLVKATSTTGDWLVADTARGIVSGSEPRLSLNSTAAEVTGEDWLDPYAPGFTVNQTTASANASGVSYIFLAIS